ncbi:hypothetical protein [Plantactinospora endophytica]|uniref:Lantibiotic dehydratase N-terminal domain-containing protein n=1 Tax=Plantactinospora endophytica TaxID=673535 RepID=A0ABQ4E719_9ACTN|nr:hypothetical protein [Plantactinospora endophytica]GIG90510.1 hypothetical protein Pen02_54460 [Plantactinospora endophytica]
MASRTPWQLFPVGLLRSAGLPFEWLDDLGRPELDSRADAAAASAAELGRVRTEVIAGLKRAQAECGPEQRPALNRTLKAVIHYRPAPAVPPVAAPVTQRWQTAVAAHHAAEAALTASLATALATERELLRKRAYDEAFLEGVLMSSPHAHDELVRSVERGRMSTRIETTAYRYLQRFCAKAETTGHVGPLSLVRVGDAYPTPAGSGVRAVYRDPVLGELAYWCLGDGRRGRRRTSISFWAAEALAEAVLSDSVLGIRLRRPRRVIGVGYAGLSPAERAVLDRADGSRTLAGIAAEPGLGETVEIATALAGRGLLRLDRHFRDHTADPGADLRGLLAGTDAPATAEVAALLDDITRFADLRYPRRPAALSALADRFTTLTGRAAWRGGGRISADRAILYEDALDNVRGLRIGGAGAGRLADRLGTVLDLLASLAIDERVAGQRELDQLLRGRGCADLPATEVRRWSPSLPAGATELLARLVDPAVATVRLTRADLAAGGLIRPDLDRWPLFGAADLMLVGEPGAGPQTVGGRGPDDGGEPLVVLSELHHIWPLLARPVRGLYPDEQLGVPQLGRLLAEQLAPAQPTVQEIRRAQKGTDNSPAGHRLLCLDTTSPEPGAVSVDDLRVRRWANGFIGLHDPHTRRDLWLLPEYDDTDVPVGGLVHCTTPALELPRISVGEHTPRIVVDGVVLQRRRWDPRPTDVPTFGGPEPTARDWRRLHDWRRRLGLPRHAFYLADAEAKPMFLDFGSVLSVRSFVRTVGTATAITLTEMLPEPPRLWLGTPDGTLTSELRTLWWRGRAPVPARPEGG